MNKVKIGIGTIIGLTLTAVGTAATAWSTAEGAASHIKPGELAVITVASGLFTMLGRMYQAAQLPAETVPAKSSILPQGEEEQVS
jgi:hypothetical protein